MKFPKIPYWYLLFGPTIMIYVGWFMNAVALAGNNGLMPVLPAPLVCPVHGADLLHSCSWIGSHMKLFADWIYSGYGFESLGDILQDTGIDIRKVCLIIWAVFVIKDLDYYEST